MITRNRYNMQGDTCYQGLSTDQKPTDNVPINSLFLELDSGDFYYFDGEAWQMVGGSSDGSSDLQPLAPDNGGAS